jgi:hypothetical protein
MRLSLTVCLVLAITFGAGSVRADQPGLERFFGSFEGITIFQEDATQARDLRVIIRPFADGGFTVRWRTIIFDGADEPRGRTQVIYFKPINASSSVFAATKPNDAAGLASDSPLDGRPFAWAAIEGDTISVHVLTITEDGDYTIQTYDRTLTEDGMTLRFLKLHDGSVERRIYGIMKRLIE